MKPLKEYSYTKTTIAFHRDENNRYSEIFTSSYGTFGLEVASQNSLTSMVIRLELLPETIKVKTIVDYTPRENVLDLSIIAKEFGYDYLEGNIHTSDDELLELCHQKNMPYFYMYADSFEEGEIKQFINATKKQIEENFFTNLK